MDRTEYDKMSVTLSDNSTYKTLNKDPTALMQGKRNRILFNLKKDGCLSKDRLTSGSLPSTYGLPKIHKTAVPLRPIVSFCTLPTYSLSRFLAKLLSPLVGCTTSAVRNSKEFVSFFASQSCEILASFDVVPLLTKVLVQIALEWRLKDDDTLSEHTNLTVKIMVLQKLRLDATYYLTYQQIFGMAMGSPVSVVVANLVMEDVEERALTSYPIPPHFWKCYVDDMCLVKKSCHC